MVIGDPGDISVTPVPWILVLGLSIGDLGLTISFIIKLKVRWVQGIGTLT